MKLLQTKGYEVIDEWLRSNDRSPFLFQQQTWQAIQEGKSGLVNAPTGSGKTFSVFIGALIQFINANPSNYQAKKKNGLQLMWITPLRALAKDIGRAMAEVIAELGMSWAIGIRNGDTDTNERQRQKRQMPEVLIITPESLQLLLAQKGYPEVFRTLKIIAVDEWHELLGSKRGVQVELAISRLVGLAASYNPTNLLPSASTSDSYPEESPTQNPKHETRNPKPKTRNPKLKTQNTEPETQIWGISATIGNLSQARDVLLATLPSKGDIIKADIRKNVEIESIIPDEIEKYPWAGHLGIKLAEKVLPILEKSQTTLIFINTRGMSELWYQ
ncbi:MAG TPA: DEAD/DEAH box helicase, partial [Cyclobacteriaceae bacterium]|nr:DEAD/DEAH box helicase [Cyclobacteriaceae bacterium]